MNAEILKILCGAICETVSLIEGIMAEDDSMTTELQQMKKLHDIVLNCDKVNDVEEWQLVSIMILGEKARNIDACLTDILNSECLELIEYIRVERGSSK